MSGSNDSITLTLPDGKELKFAAGANVLDVATEIGPGLVKAALAGRIDGELVDLRRPIIEDARIEADTLLAGLEMTDGTVGARLATLRTPLPEELADDENDEPVNPDVAMGARITGATRHLNAKRMKGDSDEQNQRRRRFAARFSQAGRYGSPCGSCGSHANRGRGRSC